MATFDNNFRSGYIVRINWWVNSQNIANNCTNITVQAQLISTGSSYTIRASAVKNGTLNIDGTAYNFTFNASLSGNQTKTVFEKNIDIYHNGDGTRSCYMGLDLGIEVTLSGKHWGTVSTSGTATFTTIPRKSEITSITGGTIGGTMTVNIDRKSSAFTTSVWLFLGDQSWVNVANKSTATSITFTVPNSLANAIPNATSGNGTVKIRTYNGDTELGECDWGKSFEVPDWMKPSISQVLLDTDTCVGNDGWMFVQWKSKMRVRTTASGSYGSWITGIRVDYDGTQYWGSDIWTNIQTINGNRPGQVHAWDSRGRYTSWSGNATVQWYQNPWGSLSAYRCDANGNRDDINGTYVKVAYSGYKASHNGYNGFDLAINHRESGKDWSSNDVWSGSEVNGGTAILGSTTSAYDLDKTYEIKLVISDYYTSTTYIFPISTSQVLLDFKAGGKGLGVGRVATKDYAMQLATSLEIYSGRDNNPAIGSDIRFCNVSNEAQDIIICGGAPAEDYLLSILRATASASGGQQRLMFIDKWNNCYNTYPINYYSGSIRYYGSGDEGQLKFDGSKNYLFFHNPNGTYNNHNIGAYSASGNSAIWEYADGASQLLLKSGYGTVSDGRLKYDIDEFSNWDDFYNFYMSLKPKTFKYNNDMRNETHIGLIAQEVGESIVDNNLNNDKLCIVKATENEDMDDGREYNIAYQELIGLNIKMIQKHEKEIQNLNNIISQQQEEIDQLKDIVNQLINQGGK